MDKIKLIIGLGNPGKEYDRTRHNAGFLFIDALESKNFPPTEDVPKGQKNKKIILAKSESFMNESGKAVAAAIKFYKLKPENILVAHDDIDILWGTFKFSFGRSSAGHKGVESIIKALKSKNFWRIRIGIQPAFAKTANKQNKKIKLKYLNWEGPGHW